MATSTAASYPYAKEVYTDLLAVGFTSVQAIGIMANMINESGLNPESGGTDNNGYYAGGLVAWNTKYYPAATIHSMQTGNISADIKAQVAYLASYISTHKPDVAGTSGAQVAGQFAQTFENCAGCQPGGTQYQERVANASIVESWVKSGNWPTSGGTSTLGGGSGTGGSGGTGGGAGGTGPPVTTTGKTTGGGGTCQPAWTWDYHLGSVSISNCQVRAAFAVLVLGVSVVMGLVGLFVLLESSGLKQQASRLGTALGPLGKAPSTVVSWFAAPQVAPEVTAGAAAARRRREEREERRLRVAESRERRQGGLRDEEEEEEAG